MSLNKISINDTTTVNTGIVYDISKAHNRATYTDLADALGTNGLNVPLEVREGGMSVKFIRTSDNKYVQWRLMNDDWSIDVNEWQSSDESPELLYTIPMINTCWNYDTGNSFSTTDWIGSKYLIPVNPNEIIQFSIFDNEIDFVYFLKYSSTKTYIGYDSVLNYKTYTIPDSVRYLGIDFHSKNLDKTLFTQNSFYYSIFKFDTVFDLSRKNENIVGITKYSNFNDAITDLPTQSKFGGAEVKYIQHTNIKYEVIVNDYGTSPTEEQQSIINSSTTILQKLLITDGIYELSEITNNYTGTDKSTIENSISSISLLNTSNYFCLVSIDGYEHNVVWTIKRISNESDIYEQYRLIKSSYSNILGDYQKISDPVGERVQSLSMTNYGWNYLYGWREYFSDWVGTEYAIRVIPGITIRYPILDNAIDIVSFVKFNKYKIYLGFQNFYISNKGFYEFTIPEDTYFLAVDFHITDMHRLSQDTFIYYLKDEIKINTTYWTCIGDSITSGNYENTGESYATFAKQKYGDSVILQKLGYWGHTMGTLRTAYNSISSNCDIVTINFGANDYVDSWDSLTIDEILAKDISQLGYTTFENLCWFIRKMKADRPKVTIVVLTPIKRGGSGWSVSLARQGEFVEYEKQFCKRLGIPVVDIHNNVPIDGQDDTYQFAEEEHGQMYYTHPNDLGRNIIANYLVGELNIPYMSNVKNL